MFTLIIKDLTTKIIIKVVNYAKEKIEILFPKNYSYIL